jgi:hypothetical protein
MLDEDLWDPNTPPPSRRVGVQEPPERPFWTDALQALCGGALYGLGYLSGQGLETLLGTAAVGAGAALALLALVWSERH